MPPTPFSSVDDSEGATISGTDGDAVFKNASNGSTTVNSITPLSTNLGSGVVRIDTSSSKVGINTSPARDLHVNSSSQNECARFESTDTELAVEFKDTTGVEMTSDSIIALASFSESPPLALSVSTR